MSSLDAVKDGLTKFLLDPKNRPLLAIVKGLRNGIVYGIKIRFPHALIMTFLFRSGTLEQKFSGIFRLTIQHARNLSVFVTIYKTLMYIQRSAHGGREERLDSFFAGLVGGCYIFGNDSAVVQQVLLHLGSKLTGDESIRICKSYAGTRQDGDKKGSSQRRKRNGVKIFLASFWEFDVGGGDVSLPMASRHHPAEHEKFNEVFIRQFRPLGLLEEFLVAQYIEGDNRTGIEEWTKCIYRKWRCGSIQFPGRHTRTTLCT